MTRISILIPVYNAARVLDETLDSAISEAASVGAEVIALDDGSTDDSVAVLARRASHLRFEVQSNRGVSATRNTLADMASGDWLLFLDADDLLLPGTLRARVDALAVADVDAIHTDWRRFRDDTGARVWGEPITRDLADVHSDPALALFSGFWSPPGAWLFKRSVHQAIGGFRADLPVIQDARYALDAALSGARIGHAQHLGFAYREGQALSLSQRDGSAFARDCLLHAQQVEQIFRSHNRLGNDERAALVQTYEFAARTLAASSPDLAATAVDAAWRHQFMAPSLWLRCARIARCAFGGILGMRVMASATQLRARGRR